MEVGQDGGRMTVKKTDKVEEGESKMLPSRSVAITHLRLHLVTFLSPHAITLSPHVCANLSPIPLAAETVNLLSCNWLHP